MAMSPAVTGSIRLVLAALSLHGVGESHGVGEMLRDCRGSVEKNRGWAGGWPWLAMDSCFANKGIIASKYNNLMKQRGVNWINHQSWGLDLHEW